MKKIVPITPPSIDHPIATHIQKKMSPGKKGKITYRIINIINQKMPIVFLTFTSINFHQLI